MFTSILDLPTPETTTIRNHNPQIPDSLSTYLQTFTEIHQTLNRADPKLLQKLYTVQQDNLLFQTTFIIPNTLKLYPSIETFSKSFKMKYKDVITDLQHIIYDHSYELGFIVDAEKTMQTQRNEELKRRFVTEEKLKGKVKEGLTPEFQSKIDRISRCINYQYEQYIKQQFIDSMDLYFSFFNSLIDIYRTVNNDPDLPVDA